MAGLVMLLSILMLALMVAALYAVYLLKIAKDLDQQSIHLSVLIAICVVLSIATSANAIIGVYGVFYDS